VQDASYQDELSCRMTVSRSSFTPQRILKANDAADADEPEGMWDSRDKEEDDSEESGSEEESEEEEEDEPGLTRAQIKERKAKEAKEVSIPGRRPAKDASDEENDNDGLAIVRAPCPSCRHDDADADLYDRLTPTMHLPRTRNSPISLSLNRDSRVGKSGAVCL
jgi:hypothetical protein